MLFRSPVQRKACREFAKKMGWIIVGEEQETGVSGFKVSADDRDKLQLVKEKAELKKFDILLVFMFDRLGRRSDETPFVVEWFVKKGIRVWSVNEGEQRFESHTDRLNIPKGIPKYMPCGTGGLRLTGIYKWKGRGRKWMAVSEFQQKL